MNYDKQLYKFFNEKKKFNYTIKKINLAKSKYKNSKRLNKNASKAIESNITKLEKKNIKFFEITPEEFIIYTNSNKDKVFLQVKRLNLENINNQIDELNTQNLYNKTKLLNYKYELLFELFNMDQGSSKIKELEEFKNYIATKLEKIIGDGDKLINKLKLKKIEKEISIKEQLNTVNVMLSSLIENLKDEENKELKQKLLIDYSKLNNQKQNLHESLINIGLIENEIIEDIKVNKEETD